MSEDQLELGDLLDLAKQHCADERVKSLIEELMVFEKSAPYSYKNEIRQMLKKYIKK